jgi:zinc protease
MPIVGPMKPFKAPPRQEWKLPNGLRVVLVTDRRSPMVTAKLAIRSGAASLPAEDAGLADALAELLTDGTARRSSKAVADAADEYGGRIAAAAGPDDVVLESYCLSEHAEKMLSLMAEVALTPSFPESEVALRRKNMQDELGVQRSDPDFLAGVAFHKKLFGAHPYAVTAPTDASIKRISRARIVKTHRRLFTPRSALLVLVGDIGPAPAKALVRRSFGGWRGAPGPAAASAVTSRPRVRRVYVVDRPGSVQTSLFLGNLAIREDHPSYFDFLLASQILGGSFSSRLVSDIRESKGYTYRIDSRIETFLTAGVFRVRTPVRNEVVKPALEAVFAHLDRIRRKQVSPEELAQAKNYLAGSFARGLETQEGLASALLHVKLRRLPENYLDAFVTKLQAVDAAGVLRAAETFIRPEEMVVVAVGDASRIKAEVMDFSSERIHLADQDGN